MKMRIFILILCLSPLVLAQDAWEQMNDFPIATRMETSFTTSDHAYLMTLVPDYKLYRYDEASDTWALMNDFPEWSPNYYGFSYNGDGYILSGDDGTTMAKIWKYDEPNDSWDLITSADYVDFSFYGFDGSAFVQGDKVYVVTSSFFDNFRSYDMVTDTWEVLADYPNQPAYGNRGITVGDKNYVFLWWDMKGGRRNVLWEYNLVNDTWIQRPEYPLDLFNLYYPSASFSIGGYLYAGVTDLNGRFHRFNSETNSWSEIEPCGYRADIAGSFSFNGYGYVAGGIYQEGSDLILEDSVWRLDPELLDVESNEPRKIFLSSNPISEELMIRGLSETTNYSIFSAHGVLVKQGIVYDTGLNVGSLSSGMYFLKLQSAEGAQTFKFLKL